MIPDPISAAAEGIASFSCHGTQMAVSRSVEIRPALTSSPRMRVYLNHRSSPEADARSVSNSAGLLTGLGCFSR